MHIERVESIKNIKRKNKELHPAVYFMKIVFKGVSQVILVENTGAGIIIFLAIAIASFPLALIMLGSVIIGTALAFLGKADKTIIEQGLFGFNAALTGIALTIFLDGDYHWIIAFIGAAVVTLPTAAFMHLFKHIHIPYLTFPFISLTWVTLLVAYKLPTFTMAPSLTATSISQQPIETGGSIDLFSGFLLGISEVYFVSHILTGLLILIAMFWTGWKYGFYTLIASLVGLFTAYSLGGESDLVSAGFFGYNAVLTMLAVGIIFKTPENKYAFFTALIGSMITVIVTSSISVIFMPFGLPVLTIAFVLTTWIILAARKVLPVI